MKNIRLTKKNIPQTALEAKKVLNRNGLVIIPTDTVYVTAVKATSSQAVKKIYEFKGRKFGKGISVFLNNKKEIKKYAKFSPKQEQIFKALLPGPFTLVLQSKGKTAPEIEPEDQTIGIRVITQPFIQELTKICPYPVTATSANISGKGPHYSISAFLKTLSKRKKEMIDLIIDAGQLEKKSTSTVVRLVKDKIEYLRKGTLQPKILEEFKSNTPEETQQIAQQIYKKYFQDQLSQKAVFTILKGDLGAGKTVFAKGIGKLFNQSLTSPTFVLLDEYKINQKPLQTLYHLDLYRIEEENELTNLKINKLLKKNNLLLIEWGEKLSIFQNLKKENAFFYLIQISTESESKRIVKLYKI